MLDRAGNSGAKERIALIERFIAVFGKARIGLLLGDREFIGTEWLNYLIERDIPFVIRMRAGLRATTVEGRSGTLDRLLVAAGGRRRATVTLDIMARAGVPGPEIAVRAVRPAGREPVIVATKPRSVIISSVIVDLRFRLASPTRPYRRTRDGRRAAARPPALNPRGRAAALPPSYTTTGETT